MEEVVRKIPINGRVGDFYVLMTKWLEDNLSITVIDNDEAWSGKMDSAKIAEMCNALHTTKENFLQDLKHALSENEKDFIFLIAEETFIVKKIDVKTKIKVKFCDIKLQKIPSIPTCMTVLNRLLDLDKIKRSKITKLTEEVQFLKSERQEFIGKLQQFACEKASLETMFYSKFCKILNAKKEKIAYLESQKGVNGNSTALEDLALSNQETSEDINENIMGASKRTCQDYPIPKRRYTTDKKIENSNSLSRDAVRGATCGDKSLPQTSNVDPFDSDTDIDTDDENVQASIFHMKTVTSSSDALEGTSETFLPERSHSKIVLPKRESNMTVNKSSIQKIQGEQKNWDIERQLEDNEEFTSQSLLNDI